MTKALTEERSAPSSDGDCPRCDRDVVAEIVVSSIGTGGPHTPRGDACIQYDPEGWRLFVHGECGEGP